MISRGAEYTEIKGTKFEGFEHDVFMDEEERLVWKFPGPRSFFKDKDPNAVRRGLDIQASYNTPIIETLVKDPQIVSCLDVRNATAEKTRKLVEYLLLQPMDAPAHEMTYSDLYHSDRYKEALRELVLIRKEIERVHGLGLDILGGQGFGLIKPALDPRVKAMPAALGNVLVSDDDVYTNDFWAAHTEGSNGLVASKGGVRLCDTTLMPTGKGTSPRDRLFAPAMEANDKVQTVILDELLKSLGVEMPTASTKKHSDTKPERLAKWVLKKAIPKMRAYAEAA